LFAITASTELKMMSLQDFSTAGGSRTLERKINLH
jgi:hypothetical protein